MRKTMIFALLLLAVQVCTATAEEPAVYTNGDYKYILLENGTAEIIDYTGSVGKLIVPDTLDGYRVTSIGDKAFSFCDALRSVTLPDNLTSIGMLAFTGCSADLQFTVTQDSYAEQWCAENNMYYTYPNANDWLLN